MTRHARTATATRLLMIWGLATALAGAATAAEPGGARERTITMANMSYGAVPSDLKVGDTIVWVNNDSVIHSVTARDRSFDLRLNPGQKARMPLQKAGTFPFLCIFHTAMRGTLKVAAE